MIKRLNERDMQKLGLQLTADELYSANHSSLKDAVVNFGGFCTGEIVSDQGLILTNHHCGYDAIRSHSTVENDILTNGFWALAKDQELPVPGLTATFLVRMDDVTDQVLSAVSDTMSEQECSSAVGAKIKELIDAASEGNEYKVEIKDFFEGNEFYQFTYEVFTDIRLVGAPPESVGKYGGDTDNWMWPRHTGDFSMFRVYSHADNKPADYSEENVTYTPKHHLPISIDGVENGDFAMIFGYPGSTDRYLTSFGIREALDVKNQAIVDIRAKKLEIMKEYMDADDANRIQYASTYAQTANYRKYYIGQTEQLKKNNVYDKKKKIEDDFESWVNLYTTRQDQYGGALNLIEEAYVDYTKTALANEYLNEAIFQGPASFLFAYRTRSLQSAVLEENTEKIEQLKAGLAPMAAEPFESKNTDIDRDIFAAMIQMYAMNVPADQQAPVG
ncbi:MAG: S46 family peptidase [Flavobacteriales bacterium]|nr:S46 family peptidase [Flavobacteriales bacterium]